MTVNIRLYGIIDPQIAKERCLAELARAAADGGATILQYRAKEADTRAMITQARAIVAALAASGVPLLINDRVWRWRAARKGPILDARTCIRQMRA
jgi:thiamine-phosphate pyrophosphorylase